MLAIVKTDILIIIILLINTKCQMYSSNVIIVFTTLKLCTYVDHKIIKLFYLKICLSL